VGRDGHVANWVILASFRRSATGQFGSYNVEQMTLSAEPTPFVSGNDRSQNPLFRRISTASLLPDAIAKLSGENPLQIKFGLAL
jgi:hypothetical protein